MAVKLLMTWDITPEHERDYFEFVIQEFIPGIQRLGLQPAEAWATIYGEYPQILVALVAESLRDAQRVLNTDGWALLKDKLMAFVQNYQCRIVPVRGGFQF